jgi:ankyrin repeat protein
MNLIEAAKNGHLEVVQFLIRNGADIHADNDLAIRHAARNEHLDVVRYLIENGANIHAHDDWALRYAAMDGHLDVIQYLMENGADTSYLLDNEGNPTKITSQVLTEDQIKQAKQLFTVRKIITD